VEFHVQRQNELMADKESAEGDCSRLRAELKKRVSEVASVMKKKDRLEKEKGQVAALKTEAERYRNWLKEEMKSILKSVESARAEGDVDEALIRDLQGQVKRLTATLHVSQEKNAMQLRMVEDHEALAHTLEDDILAHKMGEQELRKRNYRLEREKEKESVKGNAWHVKYMEASEALKLAHMENGELTKCVADEKAKLKLQQALYEQVRSDRNLFSKQQVQAEDEIAEMKRKFKIMAHQIDQLKEEIQVCV
jgi:chromosome segregation ATPase